MAEMEKTMALTTLKTKKKLAPTMVSKVPEIYPQPPGRRQGGMPKITLTNPGKNH